ncbi:hypothetical protein [Schaalia cardiffensis]|uniref:hypothetical protein n=1 Tax=Schaalia cardiffensis TaxID=181487 RepID=UPI0023F3077A|nr:hypothetical protein [Schaalia cardiffensis]
MTPAQTLALATLIMGAQAESACAIARPGTEVIRGTIRRIDFKSRKVHISAAAEHWIPLDEMTEMVAGGAAFILGADGRPMRLTLA